MLTLAAYKKGLDDNSVKYDEIKNGVVLPFRNDEYGYTYKIFVIFNKETVSIDIVSGIKFKNITMESRKLINGYNSSYRFYKFYLDNDKELIMETDVVVTNHSDESNLDGIIALGIDVLEECYPEIQKHIWA